MTDSTANAEWSLHVAEWSLHTASGQWINSQKLKMTLSATDEIWEWFDHPDTYSILCINFLITNLSPSAINTRILNFIQESVNPVQFLSRIVNSNTIGPCQKSVVKNCPVLAIHRCSLNLGRVAPVCPVHESVMVDWEFILIYFTHC